MGAHEERYGCVEHWVPLAESRAGTAVVSIRQAGSSQITDSGDLVGGQMKFLTSNDHPNSKRYPKDQYEDGIEKHGRILEVRKPTT